MFLVPGNGGMQIKTTLRVHLSHSKHQISTNEPITNSRNDVGKGNHHSLLVKLQIGVFFMEISVENSQKQ